MRIKTRHVMYNSQISRLKKLEHRGVADVLCPSVHVDLSKTEKDPKKLEALYRVGVEDAHEYIAAHGVPGR